MRRLIGVVQLILRLSDAVWLTSDRCYVSSQAMVQMGAHKSALPDVPTMELGDTVSAWTGSSVQVLHWLRDLCDDLHGTYVSRAHAYELSVSLQGIMTIAICRFITSDWRKKKILSTSRWHLNMIVGYSTAMVFLIILIPLTWMHFVWNRCKDPHDEYEGHVPHPRNKVLYFLYQTSVKVAKHRCPILSRGYLWPSVALVQFTWDDWRRSCGALCWGPSCTWWSR